MNNVQLAREFADYTKEKTGRCVLGSHQPDFFPYMGYFYKIFQSDLWVITDDVLFSKTGRHNYNDIIAQDGRRRFTLPIHYHLEKLNEIEIAADQKTVEKMVKTLWMEYKKADHFHKVFPVIEDLLYEATRGHCLAQYNEICLRRLLTEFGMNRNRVFLLSSQDVPTELRRDERIVWLCQHLHADTYYSGTGAKDYHVEQMYKDGGIELVYTDYQPIKYTQAGGKEVENLSVIDYVLNCGFSLPRGWKKWS